MSTLYLLPLNPLTNFFNVNIISGQTDLTSRFVSICNKAVEWSIHGVPPYTSEHAHYFQDDDVVMPTTIVLDHEAKIAQADVTFLHFLLNYFHRALQPLLRKVLLRTNMSTCSLIFRPFRSPAKIIRVIIFTRFFVNKK